jgi:SNF2 family DNA or RNA helicase
LNLQHWGDSFPRHVCWLDPTWNYEEYDQLNRRIRRRGNQMKRVFVHHILAKDTLEDRMLSVLSSKRRTQNALHDAILELNKLRHQI